MATERLYLTITNVPSDELCRSSFTSSMQLIFYISSSVKRKLADGKVPARHTNKKGKTFFHSNIDFWNNNHDAVCRDLSEKLDNLGIDSGRHKELVLLIDQSLGNILKSEVPPGFLHGNMLTLVIEVTHIKTYGSLKKLNGEKGEKVCSICLEEIDKYGAITDCGHVFHGICITKWLDKSHHCPLCRSTMPWSVFKVSRTNRSATWPFH